MILVLSLTIALFFGIGALFMLQHDLIRITAGTMLVSNTVLLFILSLQLSRGSAPIHPIAPLQQISDPLVQALTLTAVVISFGITALLLSLVYRVFSSHQTISQADLSWAERQERVEMQEADEWI